SHGDLLHSGGPHGHALARSVEETSYVFVMMSITAVVPPTPSSRGFARASRARTVRGSLARDRRASGSSAQRARRAPPGFRIGPCATRGRSGATRGGGAWP